VGRPKRPYNRKAIVYRQNASTAANTSGEFNETEQKYCERRCRAWPLRGKEQAAMEHQQPIVEWIVQMRYDSITAAITPEMWLDLRGGERLNITSVYDATGRMREIEIRAKQVA
jgi:head-tail adaptor